MWLNVQRTLDNTMSDSEDGSCDETTAKIGQALCNDDQKGR